MNARTFQFINVNVRLLPIALFAVGLWTLSTCAYGAEDAACVQWALGDVKSALQIAGVPWENAKVAVELAPGKEIKPEGFRLAIEGDQVRVTGGDASGEMYGLLELAEQIQNGGAQGDWKKIVTTLAATQQAPFIEFRANNPFLYPPNPHPQAMGGGPNAMWLDDVELWKHYIDMLARDRFNVVDVHDYSNVYPLLVHVAEYPGVGNLEHQTKNLKNFREIAAYAHSRGLKFGFMNYIVAVDAKVDPGKSVSTNNLTDYTAKAVATLLKEMPELDMLGFRIGKSGQGEDFYRKTYLKGLADSGRKDVRLYARTWCASPSAVKAFGRECDGNFDISIKYNGEQLGLPYQAVHDKAVRAYLQYPSYSYENYICNDAPYRIIWHLWANTTHRYWAWEDTGFIRRCVGSLLLGQARGFSVEPSFSWYPVYAAPYYAHPEDQKVYTYIFVMLWMTFMAWGRLSYNPQLPEATIQAAFQRHYGPAGLDIYRALQTGSKIVPLAMTYHSLGPDQQWFSPETETGYRVLQPVTNAMNQVTYGVKNAARPLVANGGPRELADFGTIVPMDSRNFVGIDEFVTNKVAGKADGRIGPEHAATLLAAAAAETRKIIAGIQVPPGHPADAWRLLKTDLLAAAALGEYNAARIRGTMHLEYAMNAGSEADYQQALKQMAESRAAWKTLSETADSVYAPLHNPMRVQTNFRWGSLLNSLETMDALIPSNFPRKAESASLTFTANEKGLDTGIVVSDVKHTINPAGSVKITCKVSTAAPFKTVLLWHKELPSTDRWQSIPMTGQGEFSVTVPLKAVGLMYQIEAQDAVGAAAIFPSALKETPWWIIEPRDLKGMNLPK